MSSIQQLYSLQLERHFLSGIIKHPEIFPEVDGVASEYDFINETHRTIFCIIRSCLSKGEKIDKVILGQKIKNLGIQSKDDIDIFKYLDALSSSQINAKAGIDSCKELIKLRIRREICETADKIKDFVTKNGELKIDELIGETDKIYNEKINCYNVDEEPKDLFGGIAQLVNDRGNNPVKEIGLITGFPEFNRLYGGVRAGNGIYCITSRAKEGKSSFLLNMAQSITMLNEDTICLYLDTEMQTEVSQFRAAAANSGVPMWYIESGNFSKNKELNEKIKKVLPEFEKYKNKVYHLNVVNRPIEQICSLVRRFYYKNVGRISGRRLLVIYDYIKLTGEKLANHWGEHQAIGQKTNYLNELGNELNVPIWVAAQSNRTAEDGVDNSSVVAGSDRIFWFAAYLASFKKKRLEQLAEDGLGFGTHCLTTFAARFMGKEAPSGHNDLVKVSFRKKEKPKYKQNYINFNLDNFFLEERGTLQDIVNKQKELYNIEQKNHKDDDGEI